ncbi:MAG: hypothetical protein KBC15_01170 [Candidatus Levybacteria bacterium]|nr:hypothetical protein [Candidatus Levybacteria bacterium]
MTDRRPSDIRPRKSPLDPLNEAQDKVIAWCKSVGFEHVEITACYGLQQKGWEFDLIADQQVSSALLTLENRIKAPGLNIRKG